MTVSVAVVIPCYNQAHLTGEALRSRLDDELPPAEIVDADDGWPDDGAGAVAALGETRAIRLARRPNGGLSAARNTGIEATSSPRPGLSRCR